MGDDAFRNMGHPNGKQLQSSATMVHVPKKYMEMTVALDSFRGVVVHKVYCRFE